MSDIRMPAVATGARITDRMKWFGDCRRWLIVKNRASTGWLLLWPDSSHQPFQTLPTFDAARELFIALTEQVAAHG